MQSNGYYSAHRRGLYSHRRERKIAGRAIFINGPFYRRDKLGLKQLRKKNALRICGNYRCNSASIESCLE